MSSEIRANKQTNRAGLGTVTYADTGIIVSGIVTSNGVTVNKDLDVDGHTNLDNVSVAGVSTFTGNVDFSAGIDVTGNSTFANQLTTNGTLLISSIAPILKFTETDNSKVFNIVGDSNSLSVRMDGTGGSDIIQKWNSNGTHSFYSNVIFNNDIDVDGHTNLDNVSVAGVTTMSGNLTISNTDPRIIFVDTNNNPDFTLHANGGDMQVENSGSGTQVKLESSGSTRLFGNVIANKDLDVDGHTNLDNVSIAGITTIGALNQSVYSPAQSNWATRSALTLFGNYGGGLAFNDNNNNGFVQFVSNSGNDFWLSSGAVGGSSAPSINATKGGAVQLYHAGTSKISTASYGAAVNGDLEIAGSLKHLGDTDTKISFDTNIIHFDTDNTERLRIASDGDVVIGNSSPVGGKLEVNTGTEVNGATEYYGQDFAINIRAARGDAPNEEGNGICFSQLYYSSSADIIRTGAIVGYKIQGSGAFGGGLKFKVQQSGANAFRDLVRMRADIVEIPHDDVRLQFGVDGDFRIKHTGSENRIYGTGAHPIVFSTNGEGSERLRIGSSGEVSLRRGGISATPSLEIHGSGNASDAEADNLRFHNWGNSSGDYWQIGVNATLDANGNNAKPSTTLKGAAIRLNAKNGQVTLITSPSSTSTQKEGLTQDANGIVTIPHQVAFFAHCTIGNHDLDIGDKFQFNTIPSSGNVAVNSNHTTFGGTNVFNTSTNTFTAPVAGLYSFTVTAYYRRTGDPMGPLVPRVNNTEVTNGNNNVMFFANANVSDGDTLSGTVILQLAANDAVTIHRRNHGTGTLRFYGPHSHFCGHLIG